MHIQRAKDSVSKFEYGCDLRRLYPWGKVAEPSWGGCIASVRPNESTTRHAHDEFETFIVLSGRGRMTIGSESEQLVDGDVVFIPKNQEHEFLNLSDQQPLVFLSVFWDSPEARERLQAALSLGNDDL
jgi:mannose-6-phosphate isomerase-like protein (cupin superfamily)